MEHPEPARFSEAVQRKMDGGLLSLFAKAAAEEISMDTQVACTIRTSGDYRPAPEMLRASFGKNIHTVHATLRQLAALAQDEGVAAFEGSKPLTLMKGP